MKDLFETEQQTGERLAQDGMDRAADHADKVKAEWTDLAFKAFCQYARQTIEPFQTIDVRRWATWIPEPPDKRAWGKIPRMAMKQGVVRQIGFKSTKSATGHNSPASVWEMVR